MHIATFSSKSRQLPVPRCSVKGIRDGQYQFAGNQPFILGQVSMTSDITKLLIVDGQKLFTDLLQANLISGGEFYVESAKCMTEAVNRLQVGASEAYDIVLLELDLSEPITVRAVGNIAKLSSPAKTVLFSRHADPAFIESCVEVGAFGFIPKTLSLNAFKSVLNFIASGQVFIPAKMQSTAKGGRDDVKGVLTQRELSVLGKISIGLSNKQIADCLDLQESTVKMRVRSLCKKLGAANRTQALVNAQRQRILPQH